MRMYDLIQKKRNGGILLPEEIHYMIQGYMTEEIPDYQMSAMLMAIYFQGMNEEETLNLTLEMAKSGDLLDLSSIEGIKVDKHSTGGVGDKTTLVLAPMVAAAGIPIAKMSGRGLGHTGGTIDKLESFPGFTTSLPEETFIHNVNSIKLAISGQTANLAPADKKLYALRDVTATVDQKSLIAASIMSKKLASGADAIVLDVKTGSGAFMKTKEEAVALAKTMVCIGNRAGRKTTAVISDMDQPLGYAVGNALEVKEAIETLKGNGPKDLTRLCIVLGSHMLFNAKAVDSLEKGEELMQQTLTEGIALKKLAELVHAQGGNEQAVYDTSLLPSAAIQEPVYASLDGCIEKIYTDEVGAASLLLGCGRTTKDSTIDLSAGLILHKKTGDSVKKGDIIAVLHGNDTSKIAAAKDRLLKAFILGRRASGTFPLIRGVVTE
ncbi:MAG: pyrimidine-nucleoside phosphorylase [Lachnospiraceae bacterium]|nr:pyrimidine-nucleoside phosphorylase [Lachnospiraceae bacterium]